MATPTLAELIAAKQKEIKAKSNRVRPYKLNVGKHIIRVLPSWRGKGQAFWHDYGQHFIKDDAGEMQSVYLCTDKTYGKQCNVCDAIKAAGKSAQNDSQIALLEQARSGAGQYLFNVLVRSDKEKALEPQVLSVGSTIFEAILALFDDYGDITDITEGYDLIIERQGTGRKDTRYSVRPLPKEKCKPVPKEVLDRRINLDEYVAQESDSELTKALTAIGNVVGLKAGGHIGNSAGLAAPAARAQLGRGTAASLPTEVPEADYAEFVEVASAGGSAAADDDDMDSLLAGLDA